LKQTTDAAGLDRMQKSAVSVSFGVVLQHA
jgi:hypothetical protein